MRKGTVKIIDPAQETQHIIDWIKDYFAQNGPGHNAIIGLSGGKDSAIAAALCVRALGPDRVIGVSMPAAIIPEDPDLRDVYDLAEELGIRVITMPIGDICDAMYKPFGEGNAFDLELNSQILTNTPARIRMALLYQVAAVHKGRVCCTCNWSEDYVGYSTKFGDMAGDFAPLKNYTVRELKQIGHTILSARFVEKTPADNMCGLSDEENLGFSYEELDAYLLNEAVPSAAVLEKIVERHKRNVHKERCINIPACRVQTRRWENHDMPYWEDEEF